MTSIDIGKAMLNVARHGFPKKILEVPDIQDAARVPAGMST